MEAGFETLSMELEQTFQGQSCGRGIELAPGLEPLMSLAQSRMVLARGDQEYVTQGQSHPVQRTFHTIGIARAEGGTIQVFGGEEEIGAAVQEPPGGFVERHSGRIPMVLAPVEQRWIPDDPPVSEEKFMIIQGGTLPANLGYGADDEPGIEAGGR